MKLESWICSIIKLIQKCWFQMCTCVCRYDQKDVCWNYTWGYKAVWRRRLGYRCKVNKVHGVPVFQGFV